MSLELTLALQCISTTLCRLTVPTDDTLHHSGYQDTLSEHSNKCFRKNAWKQK